MAELIGQTIGQYKIVSVLGEGGMATVYRAHQTSMKRDVAMKVIESRLARNPEFVRRFEREAQTVASLDHPHILKVFDFGQQDDLIYLVMELKTGGTLLQGESEQLLTLERITMLLTQIVDALDYAHGRGIIHRDLKPQNVLLDENGNAFLTDFGIAKLIQPDHTALTQTGASMGTPTYMSPEQWQGRALDSRSDLYSLGIMLYQMITGQPPFRADTPASMMYAHLNEMPPPLERERSSLPRYVEAVIKRALAKSPDDRFQTGKELVNAFKNALNGLPPAPPPMSPVPPSPVPVPQPRRQLSLPFLIAGGLVLLFVIGGLIIASQRNNNAPLSTATSVATTSATATQAVAASATTATTAEPSVVTVSASQTSTATLTATPTTVSPTDTATLDLAQIVASLDALATEAVRVTYVAGTQTAIMGETLTVTAWTKTPTETATSTANVTASIEAFLTQRSILTNTADAIRNQTETATVWTKTPTVTNTATITSTPTSTFTPSYTSTPISTPTPTITVTPIPTSTPTPFTSVTRNDQWTPQIVTIDDVVMVVVPSGCFMMGNYLGTSNELPVHEVCITSSFYLDRFEVTNAQFALKGGTAAQTSRWTDDLRPRETISWDEADAYCKQRGGRLPTEAEWEYAARGPDGLVYPWGNSFVSVNAMYYFENRRRTGEIGEAQRAGGQSWVGAYDMSGNVWEWIADFYNRYPNEKQLDPFNTIGTDHLLRGGASFYDAVSVRSSYRLKASNVGNYVYYVGLRCARSF